MTLVKCPMCYKKWETQEENGKDKPCPECERKSGKSQSEGEYQSSRSEGSRGENFKNNNTQDYGNSMRDTSDRDDRNNSDTQQQNHRAEEERRKQRTEDERRDRSDKKDNWNK